MKLGIGIITYERRQALEGCLVAVRQFTETPFHLVVADDGSADGTAAGARASGVPVVTGRNRGVAWNKNRALAYLLQHTDAEVILLLEDDTWPTEPGWEQAWIAAAERWGHVNLPDPAAAGESSPEGPLWTNRYTGCCTGTTRALLEAVGYLDTRFQGYGYEHVEWTERIRRHQQEAGAWPEAEARSGGPCLRSGVEMRDCGSYRDEAQVATNAERLQTLRGEPLWRPAGHTEEERRALRAEVHAARIEHAYRVYLAEFQDAPEMAISLQLAHHLWGVCEERQPRVIADLGSGFSSFVLRLWAKDRGAAVYTTDDDPGWLEVTRRFLAAQGLSTEHLDLTLFTGAPEAGADLVFHDLGEMERRAETLELVSTRLRPGGVAVLDDLHRPDYRNRVAGWARESGLIRRSLREVTLDGYGRYAWRVEKPAAIPPTGPLVVVTQLDQAKAYALPHVLPALDALIAPESITLRFLVSVAGELDAESAALLQEREARGWQVEWGPPLADYAGREHPRNLAAAELRERGRQVLIRDHGDAGWVFWLDSDVLLEPDTLVRALAHPESPVVSGLVLERGHGHAFAHREGVGAFEPAPGSQPVTWTGFGCILTRGDLAREISWEPYLTGAAPQGTGEDGYWCLAATERTGQPVRLDADIRPWHVDDTFVAVRADWEGARMVRRLKVVGAGAGGFLIPRFDGDSPRFGLLRAGEPFRTDTTGAALSLEEMRELAGACALLDFVEPPGD